MDRRVNVILAGRLGCGDPFRRFRIGLAQLGDASVWSQILCVSLGAFCQARALTNFYEGWFVFGVGGHQLIGGGVRHYNISPGSKRSTKVI